MNEENVTRVDKRPAAIYSVIIFMIVFTVGYVMFPQISMILPFFGENVTKQVGYIQADTDTLLDEAENVYLVTANKISKADISENDVFRTVTFSVDETLKGEDKDEIELRVFGGSVLAKTNSRKEKFNVTYSDEAEFSSGEQYVIFLDANERNVWGKYGVLKKDGEVFSGESKNYFIEEIKNRYEKN